MPVNAIEAVTGNVWQTKQTTLGTIQPSTDTAMKCLRKTGDGALKAAKVYGSEEYVDGLSWGSPGMYVDTIGGDCGDIECQAQITNAGFQFAQIVGADTLTGTTPNYTHTIATGTVQGNYQTFYQKVGASIGPFRNSFYDAKVNKLTFNCGQDQKVAHIVQNVWAMKAASWFTTDPTATDDGTDPYNWAEADGAHTIDATVFAEVDGETLEMDRALDVHRGDDPAPACFVYGKGTVTRSFSALVTDNTLAVIKNTLYGTTSPTDGLAVTNTVNTVALVSTYTRSAVRSLTITTGKVVVDPQDFAIGPKAEGGKIPIAFGGRCLASSGVVITIVAKTGDATSYA